MISEELAQQCKAAPDPASMNELLKSCGPLIKSLTMSAGVPFCLREDASQECLLAVLRALDIWDASKAKFVTIVHYLIRFKLLDFKKKIPRMDYPIADYDQPSYVPRQGTSHDLEYYFSKLPERESNVLRSFLRGGNVDRKIKSRAIKNIRRALKESKEEFV